METISYFQVHQLVQQLPEERLPAAYRMLLDLAARGEALQCQLEFMRLPLPERREILARQARELTGHYEEQADERSEWQAGEFLDEGPAW